MPENEIMKPSLDRALRQIHAAAEAMKHSAAFCASVIAFQNLDRLGFGFARVNHYRKIALTRRAELSFEDFDLHVAW